MSKKKTKLTIYLIKEDYGSIESIVDFDKEGFQRYDIANDGELVIRRSGARAPSWITDFFIGVLDAREWSASSVSAVFFIPVEVGGGESVVVSFCLLDMAELGLQMRP